VRTLDHHRRTTAALVLLVLAAAPLAGCGGVVPAPKAYATWLDKGGKFVCDYPKGWEADGGGKPDSPMSSAKFSSGSAEILVTADFAGSLFGDMARSTGSTFGQNEEPPVAKVHVHPVMLGHMKDDYNNYTEREPKVVKSKGLGEGRRSTFIADGSLGGKLYGYRATYLGGDRRITVICVCPATNWTTLKPAFEKVIDSLRTSP